MEKVVEEEVDVSKFYELCREFMPTEGVTRNLYPCTFASKTKALGWLGECAIEMYLDRLCRDCNLLIDNRSTPRRYGVVVDLKSKQLICGDTHLQYELFAISEAVLQGELRTAINLEMSFAIGSTTHRITPGGSLRALDATRNRQYTPFRGTKELMLTLIKKALIEGKDEVLSLVKEEISSYLNWVVNACGRLIVPSVFHLMFAPDVVYVKLSEHQFHGEIPVTIELWTRNGFEELGRTSIIVNAKIGQIEELILIESKASGKSLNPDPKIISEVRTRLSFEKLGTRLTGYLLYLFHRKDSEKAKVKIYRIL